jgi:hypothetical protein
MQLPLARKIPAKLHDRCFNCLSLSHRVATCRLSWRCRGYRHLASDCKWPRRAGDGVRGRGWGLTVLLARALCQSRTKWLWGAPRPSSSREVDVAVTGNVASATVTCCPQEPDPLAVALCEGTEPPVWVDPMFDELAASLVVSRSVGASTLGHPSTPPAAPLVAQALLADTHSPPRMVQLIYTDAEASGVDDRPPTPLPISPLALAWSLLGASLPRSRPHPQGATTSSNPSLSIVGLHPCVWQQSVPRGPLTPPSKRKKVLVSKWKPSASQRSDTQVVADFNKGLQGPLDSAKREALRALLKFDVAGFVFGEFNEAC